MACQHEALSQLRDSWQETLEMSASPQMRIALGHLYEKDTYIILTDLGFANIQWMNEEEESKLSYDYIATKDGEEFFIEVRSRFSSGPILFSQRKLSVLAPLKNVLLVLWHVKDEVVDIVTLDNALNEGLIRLVDGLPLRKMKTRFRRRYRRTTFNLPVDILKFLDAYAEVARKDRDSFLALIIDMFHDKIITFIKRDYTSWLRRVRIENAEKVEDV